MKQYSCSFYLLLLLLSLFYNHLQAQRYLVQHAKNIYIAENDGLVYSHDGGKTFDEYDPKTTGIIDAPIYSIFVVDHTIYAGTDKGLSISYDGGHHFVTRTTKDGLGSNEIQSVYVRGENVYVGTANGLSISHDGGKKFINYVVKRTNVGKGSVADVYVNKQGIIYVATLGKGPLNISDDDGKSFRRVKASRVKGQISAFGPSMGNSLSVIEQSMYIITGAGLYVSRNNGKTLTPSKRGRNASAIYAKRKSVYIALDESILISHDGGKTFIRRKIPKDSIGRMMVLGQDIYGVGGCGYVVSHDDGKTFKHKMNNYQFKITSITPCIERYNATNDVFLTG